MTETARGGEPWGNRFRKRRLELGLTQVELSERLGLTQQAISKIENGRVLAPKWPVAKRVIDILGEDVLEGVA